MKVYTIATSDNKTKISASHEQMQNKAYAEIYRRTMAGEIGPFKIDYYAGREPVITNIGKKNTGIISLIKNILKKILK